MLKKFAANTAGLFSSPLDGSTGRSATADKVRQPAAGASLVRCALLRRSARAVLTPHLTSLMCSSIPVGSC
jgi:hypothetical protein